MSETKMEVFCGSCGQWHLEGIHDAVAPRSEPVKDEPKCIGPFGDAFDCPVHDPRKKPLVPPSAQTPVLLHGGPICKKPAGHDGDCELEMSAPQPSSDRETANTLDICPYCFKVHEVRLACPEYAGLSDIRKAQSEALADIYGNAVAKYRDEVDDLRAALAVMTEARDRLKRNYDAFRGGISAHLGVSSAQTDDYIDECVEIIVSEHRQKTAEIETLKGRVTEAASLLFRWDKHIEGVTDSQNLELETRSFLAREVASWPTT